MPVELGTIDFPFKRLHYPFVEINNYYYEQVQISIFLKSD
jgi:hypothetical protein